MLTVHQRYLNKFGVVTQAITTQEALEEAEFVIDKIKNYNVTYPVAIDTEQASPEGTTSFQHPYSIWQYSDKGRVLGISSDVDMNQCYVNYVKEDSSGLFDWLKGAVKKIQ